MKGNKLRALLAVALMALALSLAGCRDGDDKEPTVTPASTEQQQNFQPKQEQQGGATPFTSPVSPLPTPQ